MTIEITIGEKTLAEHSEMVEKQIAETQKVRKEKRKKREKINQGNEGGLKEDK